MTKLEAFKCVIHDLVVDARQSEQQGLTGYASKCVEEARAIFRQRHTATLDRYGWPLLAKD